jgi:hypothetical protein
MEEMAKNPPPPPPPPGPNKPRGKSLVDRFCEGDHSVEAGLRPEKTVKFFKEAIDRNYVHVKFTKTKGGTELGVRLDREACDFGQADFDKGSGTVHIEGKLTLDYVKVRCIADIDLVTLEGKGHLEKSRLKPVVDFPEKKRFSINSCGRQPSERIAPNKDHYYES